MSELIDRQALLDECLNHYEVGNIEQNCTMDWICKTVRNFPTASPWHRVEDGLPDKNGRYLVFDRVNGVMSAIYIKQRKRCEWTDEAEEWCDFPVTHWMPLPEPPKEIVNE